MRRARSFLTRLRGLFDRGRRERELDDELRFHLNEDADEHMTDGLSASDARRAARRRMGNVVIAREETRQAWSWPSLESFRQDVTYAIRQLLRRPAFTVTALLSLALGIGANTAVFSLLKAIRWDTIRVERPAELVQVLGERGPSSTYPEYETFARSTQTLSHIIGSNVVGTLDVTTTAGRHRAAVEFVTNNYFDVLGVPARRGQVFHPPPAGLPSAPVAVISDNYWRSQFAGNPSAIGARLRVFRHPAEFTIVGIAAPDFRGAHLDLPPDIWIPVEGFYRSREDLEEDRFRLIGRLRPGVTTAQVDAEAESILGRPMRVTSVAGGFSNLRDTLTRPLLLLALVAGLVFVIMCANLANIILARTSARDRELAVRRAIGASRGRVVRQLVAESAVLAAVGAVLGAAVAYWTSSALLGFLPPQYARALVNLRFEPDAGVLAFVAMLSFLICIGCGLIPAVRVTGRGSQTALRTGTNDGGRERTWMSRSLVVGEVALCTLLLVVAGVFLRSLHNLVSQETGYDACGLLVADIVGFPFEYTEERRDQLFEELRSRIAALPGVEAASFSHRGQLDGGGFYYPLHVPGRVMDPSESRAEEARVTPGFLEAMGTPLVAGRDASASDHADSQFVAVVNEVFVRYFGIRGNPIGQRFQRTYGSGRIDMLEIVGIVKDAKWVSLREEPRPIYYVPYQQSSGRPSIRLAVRTSGDLNMLARAIVQTARSIDYSLGIPDVVPFTEIVNRSLVIERLVAHVSTAFAAVGVLIACIGLYGLLAYSVVRRRREIGVRIAVGASPGSVEWMMLRESLVLLTMGLAIGLPAGVFVVRLVSSMLFQLSPADPMTIGGALATLTMATVAATFLPARQAAGLDPIQVLRED